MVTQLSRTTPSLPPSWRDFQIYRLVKVERCSTRHAARSLQVSQTRDCQILNRVGKYLGEHLLQADSEEGRQRDFLVAQQLAAEKMESFCNQAMLAWRQSARVSVVLPDDEADDRKPPVIRTPGDVRYLVAAAKIAEMQTRLPTPKLASMCPMPDDISDFVDTEPVPESDSFSPELTEQFAAIHEEPESPPAEDCSAAAPARRVRASKAPAAAASTEDVAATCVSGVSPQLMSKLNKIAPVQQPPESPPTERRAKPPRGKQQARRAFFGS